MRPSEWNAQGYTFEPGRCYANRVFVRRILSVEDDRVLYIDYTQDDGASIGESSCLAGIFILWADRAATEEEIGRLHTSDFELQENAAHRVMMRNYARAALRLPEVITDEMLIAEVRRRGIGPNEKYAQTGGDRERK